jgi:hypothetical protein
MTSVLKSKAATYLTTLAYFPTEIFPRTCSNMRRSISSPFTSPLIDYTELQQAKREAINVFSSILSVISIVSVEVREYTF